jgi:tRNA wybutosine-synthesizing protein 1
MIDCVNCKDLQVKCLSSLEVENLAEYGQLWDTQTLPVVIFLVSTHEDGTPPSKAEWFCKSLEENANDFRVSKSYLKKLNYAVFGLGNSLYLQNYNKVTYF